jgi:preprotein translocase subunit YajC
MVSIWVFLIIRRMRKQRSHHQLWWSWCQYI